MTRPTIALKVDVDTYRGTRDGVPRLVDALQRAGADATFLFSVGPDHTGRAIKRVFRSGFLTKVRRTSVMSHYGLPTLLYGTVWPGPDIGKRAAGVMRVPQAAGFEVGVHSFDHVAWQDKVGAADAEWTRRQMESACSRFTEIFGEAPQVHGAAGWQMNRDAYRLTQRLGFGYCSDTRGTHPFIPVCQAEIIACPQLPTTLPTLDELIGRDGIDTGNVAQHLLSLTETVPATGHVFTLHAELEGMKLMPVLERLLSGWQSQGYRLASLRNYFADLPSHDLPRHEVTLGEVPGRSGTLAMQGKEFLAE
jgi:peptidoglycan/xylan/chitin deacetylase (PgdA/CDA1 family)